MSPICKELGIPLIGRFLQIESNKKEESDRARLIGNAFCDDFKFKKLDESYYFFLTYLEEPSIFGGYEQESKTIEDKIRRGNVKARMRMMYLYNLSQKTNGIVVDNAKDVQIKDLVGLTLEEAKHVVKKNICDIHEDYYKYAVIEDVEPGLYKSCDSTPIFFKWEDGGYKEIDKPTELKVFFGFTIG